MFCPNCGSELPDGSKFCGMCGNKIAITSKTEENKKSVIAINKNATDNKAYWLKELADFINHLETEKEIPEELPAADKEDWFISAKDALNIFIKGAVITAVIVPLATVGGFKATFWDVLENAAFFWVIFGVYTHFKNKKEYEKRRDLISEEREKMLNGESIIKYAHEDKILSVINKNYREYIGFPIFDSISIRNQQKAAFQTEIANIMKFAEKNPKEHTELAKTIEMFYKEKHDIEIGKLQNKMSDLKEKMSQLKIKCEDFGLNNDVERSLDLMEKMLGFDNHDISITSDRYNAAIIEVEDSIEIIEKNLKIAEEQREKAIETYQANISGYQKELDKISIKRKKYPDNELSSSFINEYKNKRCEVEEKLHLSIESIKNRASEIDAEISNIISSLNDMIEKEYALRYHRIYGRPENKMAAKFKSMYK